jgi:hypothetical protein
MLIAESGVMTDEWSVANDAAEIVEVQKKSCCFYVGVSTEQQELQIFSSLLTTHIFQMLYSLQANIHWFYAYLFWIQTHSYNAKLHLEKCILIVLCTFSGTE